MPLPTAWLVNSPLQYHNGGVSHDGGDSGGGSDSSRISGQLSI